MGTVREYQFINGPETAELPSAGTPTDADDLTTKSYVDTADAAKVTGPASATDNAVARYDGTTGKLVQNSGVTIDDSGNMIVSGNLTVQGDTTTVNTATMDVEDANITVNKGGSESTANTNKAGITVEAGGSPAAVIGFDSTLTSKFKAGPSGSESEVVTVGTAQTLTGVKTSDVQMIYKELASAPSNPPSGYQALYSKAGGFYRLTSAGAESLLGGGGSSSLNVSTKTADYTLDADTDDVILVNGTYTMTLPAASTRTRPYVIKSIGTGVVTIDGDGSETIDGASTATILASETLSIISDSANWRITGRYTSSYLAAASSEFSGATAGYASGEWAQMSGNSVSITPGSWMIFGTLNAYNGGSNPDYTNVVARWCSANGDNTTSAPAVASRDAGYYDADIRGFTFQSIVVHAATIRKTVTSNTTVYLVPRLTAGTIANARCSTVIYAEKIG